MPSSEYGEDPFEGLDSDGLRRLEVQTDQAVASEYGDDPFEGLDSDGLRRLKEKADWAAVKLSLLQQRFPHLYDNPHLDDNRSQPEIAQRPELPAVLVRQSDGGFLSKVRHDALDAAVGGEEGRNSDPPVMLILTKTRYGFSYSQPSTFKRLLPNHAGDDAGDRELRKLGIPVELANSQAVIQPEALIRSPHDPSRFVDFDELRRTDPDAMTTLGEIFVQRGWIGHNFSPNYSGQFMDLPSHFVAKDRNPLTGSQSRMLSELIAATEREILQPDYPWPANVSLRERRELALASLTGGADISAVIDRIPLRITYSIPPIGRSPSPSASSCDLPYEAPRPLPSSTTIKRGRPADDAPDEAPVSKKIRLDDRSRAGLARLPAELIGHIGRHLERSDLDTSVAALTPFRLASNHINKALLESLPTFRAVDNLIHLSDRIYRKAIPDGPFATLVIPREDPLLSGSDRAETPTNLEESPPAADDRIRAIAPILFLQSRQRQAQLVDKILTIVDLPQQVEAIRATTPYISAFAPVERSRLFEGVVAALHRVDYIDDPEHAAVWHASKSFLEGAWQHVQDADRDKIAGCDPTDDNQTRQGPRLPTFNNRYVIDLIRTDTDVASPHVGTRSPSPSLASPTMERDEQGSFEPGSRGASPAAMGSPDEARNQSPAARPQLGDTVSELAERARSLAAKFDRQRRDWRERSRERGR